MESNDKATSATRGDSVKESAADHFRQEARESKDIICNTKKDCDLGRTILPDLKLDDDDDDDDDANTGGCKDLDNKNKPNPGKEKEESIEKDPKEKDPLDKCPSIKDPWSEDKPKDPSQARQKPGFEESDRIKKPTPKEENDLPAEPNPKPPSAIKPGSSDSVVPILKPAATIRA